MKQLRLSTLSLCCLTAIMSSSVFAEEIKPLLQEGKTTLYQRVLSTPSCELLEKSDIISIHAPLSKNTLGLINYEALCKMKNSAILVNMGRGPIVVEEDLARAIDEDKIRGAALDVFEVEPIKVNSPLLTMKNKDRIILSPHIAWASVEARERLFNEVVENITAFYNGEIRNRVDK